MHLRSPTYPIPTTPEVIPFNGYSTSGGSTFNQLLMAASGRNQRRNHTQTHIHTTSELEAVLGRNFFNGMFEQSEKKNIHEIRLAVLLNILFKKKMNRFKLKVPGPFL